MKKILPVALLLLCFVLVFSAGCTDSSEPDTTNYSSVVGFWKGVPDTATGVFLGLSLEENGAGTYGYYAGADEHIIQVEWYEYGGKYYVHNSTANAGNVFLMSEDGKVLSSDDGDVLHRLVYPAW